MPLLETCQLHIPAANALNFRGRVWGQAVISD